MTIIPVKKNVECGKTREGSERKHERETLCESGKRQKSPVLEGNDDYEFIFVTGQVTHLNLSLEEHPIPTCPCDGDVNILKLKLKVSTFIS